MASVALQSQDHRDLLDIIDRLRSQGMGRYVDLPEIIVCGDQSAGKSSVLEAISGLSFPTKDNLCTRFATELVLRRDTTAAGVKISIISGPERSPDEKEQLCRFHVEIDHAKPDIGSVVEQAKDAMGLSDTRTFSTDTLRVELSGPGQPHLTLVDLPGLFRAGNSDQSVADASTIKDMVRGYMKKPRSIILAVVSAKSDFALQEVTELTRRLDPRGARTLGIITKPDFLDAGSDSEASYVRLAQNKDVVFRLGWHVLKNRSYERRNVSSAQRNEDEEKFLAQGIWTSVDPASLGVKSLRPRLSNVLKDQILRQLPSLLQDVESGISDCQSRLGRLGAPRTTVDEQRRYLLRVSQDFSVLMKAAVDGLYGDPFFGKAKTDEGYRKRLRAVVQNTLVEFREEMRMKGHARTITEYDGPPSVVIAASSSGRESPPAESNEISRSAYIDEVANLMRRSRGCELPGTFNPLIIGELFTEQCQPWRKIAVKTKDAILQAVYQVTRAILEHVSAEETTDGIFQTLSEEVDGLRGDLNREVAELLDPHYNGHPISYNHYLTDTVQKAQAERRRRDVDKSIKSAVGSRGVEALPPTLFLAILYNSVEVDMEIYASNLAVDFMQAYYKVRSAAPFFGRSRFKKPPALEWQVPPPLAPTHALPCISRPFSCRC